MAVTHPSSIRTAIANLVVGLVDSGPLTGTLELQTVAGVAVATLTFSATAFATAVNGVATAFAITSDTNAAGGDAVQFEMKDGNGNVVAQGSYGTSGTDLIGPQTNIPAGSTVECPNLTYAAPL